MAPKRKHTAIKLAQKIEICNIKSTNPTIKNVEHLPVYPNVWFP